MSATQINMVKKWLWFSQNRRLSWEPSKSDWCFVSCQPLWYRPRTQIRIFYPSLLLSSTSVRMTEGIMSFFSSARWWPCVWIQSSSASRWYSSQEDQCWEETSQTGNKLTNTPVSRHCVTGLGRRVENLKKFSSNTITPRGAQEHQPARGTSLEINWTQLATEKKKHCVLNLTLTVQQSVTFSWSRLKDCGMCTQCVSVSDEQTYTTTPAESKLMQRALRNTLMTANGGENWTTNWSHHCSKISRRLRNYTNSSVLKEQQRTSHVTRSNVT